MRKALHELSNKRKAAVMLTLLGPDVAAAIIKNFDQDYVEQLSLEVARLDRVSPEQREAIINEFHDMAVAQDYIAEGGVDHAKRVLETAFGDEKAAEIIGKVMNAMQVVPFEFLKKADPQQLLSFIQDEHPQTIALILSYLPVSQAAQVISKLSQEMRAEVAERIAMMDQTPPEVIRKVEQVLEKKVSSLISHEMTKAGGPKALVDLLNRVDRSTERLIIESLSENNPELADTVKNMMFVFEDIVQIDDRAVQQVLKEVDVKDLATALKGVAAEVQEKIFSNMSERAVGMLKEDMEFMGPVKIRTVEEAQQKIVAVIRRLEENGEISIGRGEEEELVSRRAIQNADVAVISPYDSALKPISSEASQNLRSGHKRGSSLAIRQKPIAWQEGYNSGQTEGFAKGFDAGRTEAMDAERLRYETEANQFANRIQQFADSVEHQLPVFLEKLESELAALATVIAERIISQELKLDRTSVVSIAKEALKEALPTNGVTIRVNPFDAPIVESKIEELIRASQGIKAVEISTDPTIRGGCLIETEGGAIDARIEMMLDKVIEASRSAA